MRIVGALILSVCFSISALAQRVGGGAGSSGNALIKVNGSNVSVPNFNGNQFAASGSTVSVKNGALVTNLTETSTLTIGTVGTAGAITAYKASGAVGSVYSSTGTYGSDGTTHINTSATVYASGTAYSLTAVSAALDFGTTDPVRTIDVPGTYVIRARVNLKYNASTFAASRTVTLKLRRTNNTAADLTNGSDTFLTDIITTLTYTAGWLQLPDVIYTTTNSNDSITIFGDVSVVPTAGSLDCTAASITAIRLYE